MFKSLEEIQKEKYNEIFKYVGEKCGLPKFKYEHYKRLRKTDTRKADFDEFMEKNLPIDKLEEKDRDKEFVNKINEMNDTITNKENKIVDSESFYKFGKKIYPDKDNNEEKNKPASNNKTESKESKTSIFKGIMKNIPSGARFASAVSILAFLGTRALGAYAGWPMAAMIGTANVTLLIPHIIILSYCGVRFVINRVKDGSFKKLIQKIKTRGKGKENEKVKSNYKAKSNSEVKSKAASIPSDWIKEEPKTSAPIPDWIKKERKVDNTEIPKEKEPEASEKMEDVEVSEPVNVTDTEIPKEDPVFSKPFETKIDDEPVTESESTVVEPVTSEPIKEEHVDEEAKTPDTIVDTPVETEDYHENKYNYSPRRQSLINELNDAIITNSSNTDKLIEEIELAKNKMKIIIDQTEKYTNIYDDRIIHTTEYREAMSERQHAIDKLNELKQKEKEIVRRQKIHDDAVVNLGQITSTEEKKVTSSQNVEVKTNTGETKTIYIAPQHYNVRETIDYGELPSRRK